MTATHSSSNVSFSALVRDCYVENTGDDVFVLWGGLRNPSNVTFRNCVAASPGVTRPNW